MENTLSINHPEVTAKASEILKALHELNICHARDIMSEYALAAALAIRFQRLVFADGPDAHFSDMTRISKQLIQQFTDIFSNPVNGNGQKETNR